MKELARRYPATASYDRIITTPRHHAYLKIAEGCDRFCAFCAIPLITGRYKSRDPREIEEEVRLLAGRGVKEFNIIAQDLSGYGCDTNSGKSTLANLLKRLSDIKGVEWLRLHYAYPAGFPLDILPVIAERDNICSYLDIALQHISDKVLKAMQRRVGKQETLELLDKIRTTVPDIHIRTTLMTGFPGEGDAEFDELMEFVRTTRFERMGAFAYCEEEGTFAALNYNDDIPADVKQKRLDSLMALQEEISAQIQDKKIGSVYKVMIDREEDNHFVGRTQWDSPEVDSEVLVTKAPGIVCGEFCDVRITDAMPFELIGEKA